MTKLGSPSLRYAADAAAELLEVVERESPLQSRERQGPVGWLQVHDAGKLIRIDECVSRNVVLPSTEIGHLFDAVQNGAVMPEHGGRIWRMRMERAGRGIDFSTGVECRFWIGNDNDTASFGEPRSVPRPRQSAFFETHRLPAKPMT